MGVISLCILNSVRFVDAQLGVCSVMNAVKSSGGLKEKRLFNVAAFNVNFIIACDIEQLRYWQK